MAKSNRSSFVHCGYCGWQTTDDLPVFAKICDILVIVNCSLLYVEVFDTEGINNHLSAYALVRTLRKKVIHLPTCANKQVYYFSR